MSRLPDSGVLALLVFSKSSFYPKSKTLLTCPFTGPKMFCARTKFLSQPKNLTEFSASPKTFVPAQKTILLNANHIFV